MQDVLSRFKKKTLIYLGIIIVAGAVGLPVVYEEPQCFLCQLLELEVQEKGRVGRQHVVAPREAHLQWSEVELLQSSLRPERAPVVPDQQSVAVPVEIYLNTTIAGAQGLGEWLRGGRG